jgi:hypothetical protein
MEDDIDALIEEDQQFLQEKHSERSLHELQEPSPPPKRSRLQSSDDDLFGDDDDAHMIEALSRVEGVTCPTIPSSCQEGLVPQHKEYIVPLPSPMAQTAPFIDKSPPHPPLAATVFDTYRAGVNEYFADRFENEDELISSVANELGKRHGAVGRYIRKHHLLLDARHPSISEGFSVNKETLLFFFAARSPEYQEHQTLVLGCWGSATVDPDPYVVGSSCPSGRIHDPPVVGIVVLQPVVAADERVRITAAVAVCMNTQCKAQYTICGDPRILAPFAQPLKMAQVMKIRLTRKKQDGREDYLSDLKENQGHKMRATRDKMVLSWFKELVDGHPKRLVYDPGCISPMNITHEGVFRTLMIWTKMPFNDHLDDCPGTRGGLHINNAYGKLFYSEKWASMELRVTKGCTCIHDKLRLTKMDAERLCRIDSLPVDREIVVEKRMKN